MLLSAILWLLVFKTEPIQFLVTKADEQGQEESVA